MNIFESIVLETFVRKILFRRVSETCLLLFLFKLRAGMVLKWIQNGPKIIQKLYQMVPPPHPRRQQTSPARGQKQNKETQIVDDFLSF